MMANTTAVSVPNPRDQELRARQTALDDALHRWQQAMNREEHTTDCEQNKRNLVTLKGRRMLLLRESVRLDRERQEIRRVGTTRKGRLWWWFRRGQ